MANDCWYELKAVAKSAEVLTELVSVMNYKHAQYYLYRVFEADDKPIEESDGFFTVLISGEVAWSCRHWVFDSEDLDDLTENGAHYVSLRELCERKNFGVEIYSKEPGGEFQEHYIINHKGKVVVSEDVAWGEIWENKKGEMLTTPKTWGGFPNYGKFSKANEIYNAVDQKEGRNES